MFNSAVNSGLLSFLIVGHLVGDYLLQNKWMAEKKVQDFFSLSVHCLIYTASIAVFALAAGVVSIKLYLLVYLTHFIIDRRNITKWWVRNVTKSEGVIWLEVMVDQTWHFVILVIGVFLC